MSWISLAIAVLANTSASFLLKIAVGKAGSQFNLQSFVKPDIASLIFLAIFSYGLAFLSYAYSLKVLPMHVAHPLSTALPIILIFLSSVLVFREQVEPLNLVGILLLLVGVVLIGWKA